MWKSACLVAAFGAASFAAGSSGRIVGTPFQAAIPFGSAVKMTPDPSSNWSWHHDVTVAGSQSFPVVMDVDSNGEMDTENPRWRVLITDLQIFTQAPHVRVALRDDNGDLWDLTYRIDNQFPFVNSAGHLTTPLVLAPGSRLSVDWQPISPSSLSRVRIHIIGRVVSL